MEPLKDSAPVFQDIKSTHGSHIRLPTRICPETGQRYVLCSQVQEAIEGVHYLRNTNGSKKIAALFMIDDDGQLYYPYRIEYCPRYPYEAICHSFESQQVQTNTHDSALQKWHVYLASHGKLCKELFQEALSNILESRRYFQQIAANARYHYSIFVQGLTTIDGVTRRLTTGRQALALLHQEHQELEQCELRLLGWEYQNNCYNLVSDNWEKWDYPLPNIFIVLPSDVDSWDYKDSSAHLFRIYFLCNSWASYYTDKLLPRLHLSSHTGFSINHPQEFFQIYGDQALRTLQLVKRGYSDGHRKIPPLEFFDFLSGCDIAVTGSLFSRENIGSLVDMAITYLLKLSPPKLLSVKMDYSRSAALKSYLNVPDTDRLEGNLYRSVTRIGYVHWMCQSHALMDINRECLGVLVDFVRSRGGNIDMQLATLRVELGSTGDADRFLSLLKSTYHVFSISINLREKLTSAYLESLCHGITSTGTVHLAFDGITPDILSQDNVYYKVGYFENVWSSACTNRFQRVVLSNYPRPQEQTIYASRCSLRLQMVQAQSWYDWEGVVNDLQNFRRDVVNARRANEYEESVRRLRSAVEARGLTGITEVTIHPKETDASILGEDTKNQEPWTATFDFSRGTLIGAHSSNLTDPLNLKSSESLQRLTQKITDLELVKELYCIVRTNIQLQELNISTVGRDVLHQVEHIVALCHHRQWPFTFTLFDHINDDYGRVVVKVAIGRSAINSTESSEVGLQEAVEYAHCVRSQAQDVKMSLKCLQWESDYFYFHHSDLYALLLQSAIEYHPTVLTSLTLDISALSSVGLSCIKHMLVRSDLIYLCILCMPFKSTRSHRIAKILRDVPWHTLTYLVLSGDNIDSWLNIWSSNDASCLLRLDIHGSSVRLQEISHSGALVVHRLIHASSLMELHLGNIHFQECSDWILIVDSMDPQSLKTFELCSITANQFMSTTNAVDLWLSKFPTQNQRSVGKRIVLSSFILDIVPLSQEDRERLQNILHQSTLRRLHVKCDSFDLDLFFSFSQVFASVPWPTVDTIILSGEACDMWIPLLPTFVSPQLQHLIIQGSGSGPWELSHANVLLVEQLIGMCSLLHLQFENVHLQDKNDWLDLIQGMNSFQMKRFGMCGTTWSQFKTVRPVVDVYNVKLKRYKMYSSMFKGEEWGSEEANPDDSD